LLLKFCRPDTAGIDLSVRSVPKKRTWEETTMNTRNVVSAFAGCAALLVSMSALAGDRDKDDADRLDAHLIGWQEVPSIVSDGTAVFRAKIADDDQSFQWELTYSFPATSTVTQAHIHVGQKGVSGNIFIWFCANPALLPSTTVVPPGVQACPTPSGTISGTATSANVTPTAAATAAQGIATGEFAKVLAAIRAGVAYANVHTVAHPPGEIRGQLHEH
jgi:hypothetical protein